MKTLLTGANGFVGKRLSECLARDPDVELWSAVRRTNTAVCGHEIVVGDLAPEQDWTEAVRGTRVVIHLAARAHVLRDSAKDPSAEFHRANVEGTLNLAKQAAKAGVGRFVFISSIGVNGRSSAKPFTENDPPSPENDYARSKYEAEMGLWEIQQSTGMEVVIIRPPLVYGPNAPGNLELLIRMLGRKLPLPLARVNNKRSLVALDNLVDFILTCVDHSEAGNQVFLVSDASDMSTSQLVRGLSDALGQASLLFPFPVNLMRLAAVMMGKKQVAQQLFDSLQVDCSKAFRRLGWRPPLSVKEGLQRVARQ